MKNKKLFLKILINLIINKFIYNNFKGVTLVQYMFFNNSLNVFFFNNSTMCYISVCKSVTLVM